VSDDGGEAGGELRERILFFCFCFSFFFSLGPGGGKEWADAVL
jgi:hypothetical protein